ncbi:MAG: VOC family protein [Wenzhouxiangellaceae bacterium]
MLPFHLSFAVPDLATASGFYLDVLGCKPGRRYQEWMDILFFGHQLTLHQAAAGHNPPRLDHFGVIMNRADWHQLAVRLEAAGIEFVLAPLIKNEGMPTESGKYLIEDPAGNLLEFKYYHDFVGTMR